MNIEWKDFTNSITDETSGNVKILQSNYLSAGQLPIVDQGKKLISGYTNDLKLRASVELPCIIFGDHTKILKYIDFPFALGADGVKVLKPSDDFNSKYLYYYLKQIKLSGKKSYNRNFKYLKIVKLPFIPLPEQKLIAELLDKADSIRQKKKESIALLDEFLRSVFLDMFGDPVRNEKGWDLKELSYFGKWESGGTPSRNNKEYFKGTIPWYTSGELNNMYISESIENINETAIKESNTKLIKPNSLLLGMYDTAALKSSISTINCTCNQAIVFSSLSEKPNHISYIYFCIQIGREFYRSKQRGVRQKNMNLSMVKNLRIPNPPLNLQAQFARIVEQVEVTKAKMEEGLREMDNQFEGLMQKAFKEENSE